MISAGISNSFAFDGSSILKNLLFLYRPVDTIRFVSYDSFALLCWNQRDNLQISEFERTCIQLILLCGWALNDTTKIKLRPRSHVTGYDSYPGKLYADTPCVHTFLPYPDNLPFSIRRMFIRLWKWRTNLSGEQFSKIGMDKYKCKTYPHKVCPDRNCIRLRVNKIGSLSRYLWMLFLSDETFFG